VSPQGTINSYDDTVGVAVINYRVPICWTRDDTIAQAKKQAEYIRGIKHGYPGCDLIIFPEYSLQGFNPYAWDELTTSVDGPEVEIFSEACRKHKVWGVMCLTGEENRENPGKNPWDTFLLINDEGDVALRYHKINPWVPQEPWYPGDETMVAEGPKGLKIGATICYDCSFPEIVRDVVMKGAELVVRIQGYMYPTQHQQKLIQQTRAWENLTYFAVSNLAGRDLVYYYFGNSMIVDFDGSIIVECERTPDEVQYGLLSISAVREARANWSAENHLFNILHRGYTALPDVQGLEAMPYQFYRDWANDPSRTRKQAEKMIGKTKAPLKETARHQPPDKEEYKARREEFKEEVVVAV
jgi:amidase